MNLRKKVLSLDFALGLFCLGSGREPEYPDSKGYGWLRDPSRHRRTQS